MAEWSGSAGEWFLSPLYKGDESSVGACWNACKQGITGSLHPAPRMKVSPAQRRSSRDLLWNRFRCVAWQIGCWFRLQAEPGENLFSIFYSSDEACSRHPGHKRRAAKCVHVEISWRGDLSYLACFSKPLVYGLFFWGHQPQDHTTVFFAAARSARFRQADRQAATKRMELCRVLTFKYIQVGSAVRCTCVYLRYYMFITLCNNPCDPIQKAWSRVPISWRPGILGRRCPCVRCWSREAFQWTILMRLGTVLRKFLFELLEDVKGQMAERFWLKLFTPNVDGFWFSISCLSPAQIVPNPVSSVLCMGVREIHKEQVVAYPVWPRYILKRDSATRALNPQKDGVDQLMYVNSWLALSWGISTWKTLVGSVV